MQIGVPSLHGCCAKGCAMKAPADRPSDEGADMTEHPSFTSVFLNLKEVSALVGMGAQHGA